jgi:multiple sugar transport system substrate-binding protein
MDEHLSRRSFLRTAALTLVGTAIAACGATPTPTVPPKPTAAPTAAPAAPQPTAKPAVPTVPAGAAAKKQLTVLWRSNPKELDTMNQGFKAYTDKNPGLTIQLIDMAGAEAEAKLQAMFAAGTAPEVFASVYVAGMVDYIYKDMCLDLAPYIEKDKFDQTVFQPSAVKTFQYGSKQFGIPRGGIPSGIFYNKDLFDKAGLKYPPTDFEDASWTWDKLIEYAKALTKDTNNDGKIEQWGIIAGWPNASAHSMAWGKRIFGDDAVKYGVTTKHNFLDPAVIEAWQKTADLIHVHKVSPRADVAQSVGGFASGNVGMWINLGNYVANQPNKFKWSVAAWPRGIPSVQQRSTTFTGPLMIGKGSSHDQAWDLVKYLASEEGQKFLAQGAVVGTSRPALYNWWLGQMGGPVEELAAFQTSGYKMGWETANTQTARYGEIATLITAETDPLMLGEKSAKDCMTVLGPKLDKLLLTIFNDSKDKVKQIFPDFQG